MVSCITANDSGFTLGNASVSNDQHEISIRLSLIPDRRQHDNADIVRRYEQSVVNACEKWASSSTTKSLVDFVNDEAVKNGVIKL